MKKLILAGILLLAIISPIYAYDTCGDNMCGETESTYSCAKDCPSGSADNYCEPKKDNICDKDCVKTDPDCKDYTIFRKISQQAKSISPIRLGIGIGLLAIMVGIIFLVVKKVRHQETNNPWNSQRNNIQQNPYQQNSYNQNNYYNQNNNYNNQFRK